MKRWNSNQIAQRDGRANKVGSESICCSVRRWAKSLDYLPEPILWEKGVFINT
jgi:hypothetical protein